MTPQCDDIIEVIGEGDKTHLEAGGTRLSLFSSLSRYALYTITSVSFAQTLEISIDERIRISIGGATLIQTVQTVEAAKSLRFIKGFIVWLCSVIIVVALQPISDKCFSHTRAHIYR